MRRKLRPAAEESHPSLPNISAPRGPWEAIDIIHRSGLTALEKGILIAVAKNSSRRKKICFASMASISSDVGPSERSVRRAVKHLANGLAILHVESRPGRTSTLRINWQKLCSQMSSNPGHSDLGQGDRGQGDRTPRTPRPDTPDTVTDEGTEGGQEKKGKNPSAAKAAKFTKYTNEFLMAWDIYPERDGSNPKKRAFFAWRKRVAEGALPPDLADGVRRYGAWCEVHDKTGTEFVMQAARFFGPDRPYREPWGTSNNRNSHREARVGTGPTPQLIRCAGWPLSHSCAVSVASWGDLCPECSARQNADLAKARLRWEAEAAAQEDRA